MGEPHGIGIVGLGVISAQYLETLGAHPGVRIAATADLDTARAAAVAERFDGCRALSVDELVADPSVQTVLNLTIPAAHAEVALSALGHGKNVFGEKPLAPGMTDASAVVAAATETAWVGCAPDTVPRYRAWYSESRLSTEDNPDATQQHALLHHYVFARHIRLPWS